jgi:hypothetical protein
LTRSTKLKLIYLTVFAVAMGFMESAVVIYLREIYYKDGFSFPLRPMHTSLAVVEVLREAATVIMLIGVGWFAGVNKLQRFASFIVAFAVWDIFYYVFLYIFLGWPESIFTWDILFLIPFPWVGPVWGPLLLCLLMITGSVFVIRQTDRLPGFSIPRIHWVSLIAGAAVCIIAFMWDYLAYQSSLWLPGKDQPLFTEIEGYVPSSFNHPLFFAGFLLMCLPVFYNIFLAARSASVKQG